MYEATIPLTYIGKLASTKYIEEQDIYRNHFCKTKTNNIVRNTETSTPTEESIECSMAEQLSDLTKSTAEALDEFSRSLDPNYFILTADNVTAALEYKEEQKRQKRAINYIGDAFNWCCGVATQEKMDNVVMKEHELEAQVAKLKSGLHEDYKHLSEITSHFADYDTKVTDTIGEIEKKLRKFKTWDMK